MRRLGLAILETRLFKLLLLYIWGMACVFMTREQLQRLPHHICILPGASGSSKRCFKVILSSDFQTKAVLENAVPITAHFHCQQRAGSTVRLKRGFTDAVPATPPRLLPEGKRAFKIYYCMCRDSTEIHMLILRYF